MAALDIEAILERVEAQIKARLTSKLESITTEKGDGVSLPGVETDAYFCQALDERVTNYDPFIFYGVENVESQGQGPYTAKAYSIFVLVVYGDKSNDDKLSTRLFRYQRAIEEIFADEWVIKGQVKSKVQTIPPTQFQGVNSSAAYRAAGVMLEIDIS